MADDITRIEKFESLLDDALDLAHKGVDNPNLPINKQYDQFVDTVAKVQQLYADAVTGGVQPCELALCETRHLTLKANTIYRFTVIEGCEECEALAKEYEGWPHMMEQEPTSSQETDECGSCGAATCRGALIYRCCGSCDECCDCYSTGSTAQEYIQYLHRELDNLHGSIDDEAKAFVKRHRKFKELYTSYKELRAQLGRVWGIARKIDSGMELTKEELQAYREGVRLSEKDV